MLKIKNIQTYYGNIQALKDVSIEINEGEIVTLIGANGAGKTTTLMSICGITPPRTGEILLDGDPIHGMPAEKVVQQGIVQVPEGRRIFPDMTVLENLEMGAFLRNNKQLVQQDLNYVMTLFPILEKRKTQRGGTLSGGEQQMLAIARALMSSPRLLLVDEPSVGLSPLLVSNTVTMIQQLKQKHGLTVLMAEQNFHQAIRIADRGYIIVHGEIVFEGKSVAELETNDLVKNYYLGTG